MRIIFRANSKIIFKANSKSWRTYEVNKTWGENVPFFKKTIFEGKISILA